MTDPRPAQTPADDLALFAARRRGDPIADVLADTRGVAAVERSEDDPDPLTVADHLKQIRNQEGTR